MITANFVPKLHSKLQHTDFSVFILEQTHFKYIAIFQMRGSRTLVKKECTNYKEKQGQLSQKKNVTKAKICENGNKLETCTCKLRKGSVDPKKASFHKCCICSQGKQVFPFLLLLSCFREGKKKLKFSLSSFQVNIVIPSLFI